MKSEKKFSRFIMARLMIFMGMSFILIALGIYFYRSYTMEKSSSGMLDVAQQGFSNSLNNQLDNVGDSLDRIMSDKKIGDLLVTVNGRTLLADTLKIREKVEVQRIFIIYDNLNNRFITELPPNIIALQPLLEKLSIKEKQVSLFKKTDDNVFMSIFSVPVMNMDQRVGTGYMIYEISKDKDFWGLIHGTRMSLNRILIHESGGHLYNLETGEEIPIPDKIKNRLMSGPSGYPVRLATDELLCPLKGFSNLYYAANINLLKEQKRSLKLILFSLCIFILILTLLISFFIAKIVSKPLESMANEAVEIAREPSSGFLDEERSEYFEFKKLCRAFNHVLSGLFKAQEELKSEARKELEASEERYRLTVEAAPDSITLSRFEDGRFLQVNEMFLKNTGFTEEEVIGKTPAEINLFPNPDDREKIMSELREKEEINRLEVKYRFKDGSISDSLMSARKIKYHGEDCIISIVSDYTQQKKAEEEKKRLEAALQRASKMEAIGTMAGGVAHDLNNILSGLVGYPELLLMDLPEDSRLRKPLLTMQKSGEKAAAIVQDMLTLARRGVSVTDVVNLNNIILEQLKNPEDQKIMSYDNGIKLNVDLEPNLLNIIGSEAHLSKTVMNLIANAVDSMPSGGEIKISTKNKYIDTNIRGYDTVNEGDYVILEVSDNGSGISPEDQERIFEPFYTKKKMGRSGTGLGMAVVWGTVKDHDGYIDLQSDIGKGATFKLYFPVTRKQLMEEDPALPIEKYMGRAESVLVVDDVAEQREIASGMLMRLGYSVVTASSGEDAVEYMKQNSADILVLDMIMTPGIDGLETYKRILAIHPGQKAVVASGFAETDRVKEAQSLGAGAYIKKPYLIKKIGPAIRKELDK